ncbi:hypothetical protein ACO0QE_001373 [Hanseniaspora vineae]
MASFVVDLWDSIFQPGTTPTLILATHLSFIALFSVLGWLIYVTKAQNIHFIMLLLIAVALWVTIIWFISEIQNIKLKSNEELLGEDITTIPEKDTTPVRNGSSKTSKQD